MKGLLFALFLLVFQAMTASANGAYNIKVKIEGYQERKLTLVYFFGNQRYVKDTVKMGSDGAYTFSGTAPLLPGIYTIVLMNEDEGIDVLVSEKEQNFSINAQKGKLSSTVKFSGSKENELFQRYIQFAGSSNAELDTLRARYKRSPEGAQKTKLKKELLHADSLVQNYLDRFLSENKGTYAALFVKSTLPIRYPAFTGTEQEKMMKAWYYARKHCFDNIPLQEFRLLRTPQYYQAITTYVNELLFQHPDSLKVGIDQLLNQLRPNREAFEYYTILFLKQYILPKVMGMDAVFVHLVETYLISGQVKLASAEQQNKLIQMAQKIKPLLIGKLAPDISLKNRAGNALSLHSIQSAYTMLIIWAYDCGHCKHSASYWKSFDEKFKSKGVKIVALCHVPEAEIPACWKYVDEQKLNSWLHVYDPKLAYIKSYNVESTPQVYLLDRNKVIIGKQIVAEKMEEVVARLIQQNENTKLR